MREAIIALESFSLLILFILKLSIIIEDNGSNKNITHTSYVKCVLYVALAILCDMNCYIFQNDSTYTTLLYVANYLSVFIGNLIVISCARYLYVVINKDGKYKNSVYFIAICLICLVDVIIQAVSFARGENFSIINGELIIGKFYPSVFYLQILCFALDLLYITNHVKNVGLRQSVLLYLYFLFPLISVVILIINTNASFVYTSLTISYLIVYIGIEKKEKEDLLFNSATHDPLTNLLNRTAYNTKLSEYMNNSKKVGVMFYDVNNLKYVNDTLGHLAGDKLLIKFADILKTEFIEKEIYRISGDEFVTIVEDCSQDEFNKRLDKIKDKILYHNNIASFGFAYNETDNISKLICEAEKGMYIEKSNFYKANHIERRRG